MKFINIKYFKILIIYISSYLYLNLFFKLINFDILDDLARNIEIINYGKRLGDSYINIQNYVYFKLIFLVNILINNPSQSLIILASVSYSIYILNFFKRRGSILFFINFLIFPLIPVFFISINRFALSSSLILACIRYIHDSEILNIRKKLIIISITFVGLSIHLSSILLLIFYFVNYKNIFKKDNLDVIARFGLNIQHKYKNILFIFLISFIITISLLQLNFIFSSSNLIYQSNYLLKCITQNCQGKYSIFVLPFSFLLILNGHKTYIKREGEIKNLSYLYILIISYLSLFIPIFWRFWIPLIPLLSRFSQRSIIIPNIVLLLYSLYTLPKYIML